MIKPMLEAEAERLGKLKAPGSNQTAFVETLVLDGSQIAGGSNSEKGVSAGQLTDGMVLGKTRDGRWHILRIAEAKSGAPGAPDIFGQMRKNLRRMLNADIKLKNLTSAQQSKLGIQSQTHTFSHVGSDNGLKANFSNSDIYIPFITADSDLKLPPPSASDGPGVRAIRRAMETRVARSALNTEDTHLMARIFFKQAGVKPETWYNVHASYDDFVRITRRSAKARGMDLPEKSVLEKMFAEGHRLNPDTGEWQRVIPEWQQPVLSVDRMVAMATEHYKKRTNQDPPADMIAEWRAKARSGKRFNPESRNGSWPGFGKAYWSKQGDGTLLARRGALQSDYHAPILDPLSATLTDDEKRIWLKFSGMAPTDPAERAEFERKFMSEKLAFDPETRRFRKLSEREELLRKVLRRNPDYGAAYNHRIRNMDLAGDVLERLAAATAETARIARERLHVVVHHSDRVVKVEVIPEVVYQNGKTKRLTIPGGYQKSLLRRYYQYSENMFVERKLPEWLKYGNE